MSTISGSSYGVHQKRQNLQIQLQWLSYNEYRKDMRPMEQQTYVSGTLNAKTYWFYFRKIRRKSAGKLRVDERIGL